MKQIYTIGYTSFKIDKFIEVIKEYNINCIIDVRSNPISEYYQEYNNYIIQNILKKNNIKYFSYKDEFGARQENKEFYTDGYLDFEKFTKSEKFIKGKEKLENLINKKAIVALMCAEKDPINCHRSIMIGKELKDNGYIVKNIMFNKSIETQEKIEKRLIDIYFPNRYQINFFEKQINNVEYIKKAYIKRNIEIAYRKENENE